MTISLCMIVKNEEKTIERCLVSITNLIDEIIIVDTGSTDRTKEICAKYTNLIYDFNWTDNFSEARNFSYEKASMEYILWLDADDIILPEDNQKIVELKNSLDTSVSAVMFRYNVRFDHNGTVLFSYFRERLSKRECNFKWIEPVHEYLQISGNVITEDICITHGKLKSTPNNRNLIIYEDVLKKGDLLSPRGIYYYARELKDHNKYTESIVQFEDFLATGQGWCEDNINACSELAKCYHKINNDSKELETLFRSFHFGIPRAELCCQIGYYYMDKKEYRSAIFWFKTILLLEKPKNNWGFIQHDCWDYIPLLECAVCYDRLMEYQLAAAYNDQALLIKPESETALKNKQYFISKIN